jgi:hypothetical protein
VTWRCLSVSLYHPWTMPKRALNEHMGSLRRYLWRVWPLKTSQLIRPPTPRPWQCCGVRNDFRYWAPLPVHLGPALASGGECLGRALAAIPASSSVVGTWRGSQVPCKLGRLKFSLRGKSAGKGITLALEQTYDVN